MLKSINWKTVAGTGENDEHSVGMREIRYQARRCRKYGISYTYLGPKTPGVPIEKFIDAWQ